MPGEQPTANDLAAVAFARFKPPFRRTHGIIFASSLKGGDTHALDVRGWGYLTGGGHGALGLSHAVAEQAQDALGDLVVTLLNQAAPTPSADQPAGQCPAELSPEVSPDEAMTFLRAPADQSGIVSILLAAAIEVVEAELGRALRTATDRAAVLTRLAKAWDVRQ